MSHRHHRSRVIRLYQGTPQENNRAGRICLNQPRDEFEVWVVRRVEADGRAAPGLIRVTPEEELIEYIDRGGTSDVT